MALWSVESVISPPLPPGIANALLFVAAGMIWSAAQLFHGRRVLWGAIAQGRWCGCSPASYRSSRNGPRRGWFSPRWWSRPTPS